MSASQLDLLVEYLGDDAVKMGLTRRSHYNVWYEAVNALHASIEQE